MAATDLSTVTRGSGFRTRRVSLPASAGNVRQVILPQWCRRVETYFRSSADADAAGAIADSGTDDAAQSSTAVPCPAGSSWELGTVGGGELYLSGPAAGYAHLVLSRS
jgi:hypothetical protein